jgi:arylsulfatase A-like enzyme
MEFDGATGVSMMRSRWCPSILVLGLSSLSHLSAGAAPARHPQDRARPPIVLIVLDDLGYGDLGCYGCKDIRTPNIDRLARQGVRLTDFYANGPVCTPTRAALLTGRYPQRAGLEWAISPGDHEPGLPVEETSLARMLKRAGYTTSLFGKWHLGYRREFGPLAHGFDEFFGFLSADIDHYSHQEITGEPDLYEGDRPVERKGYMTDLITERAVGFINKHANKPFFLEVAYGAVHWPFQPPDRPDDVRTSETWYEGTRQDYARMLERVDAGVGAILAALERRRLADRTLVIFTDDNGGERLSEHGPLRGFKGIVLEGGIRVPCIARWPGRLPEGKVSAVPAMTVDLTATILTAAGASPPEGRELDGIDLVPVLDGSRPAPERTLFWRIDRFGQHAARKGKWKYIRHPEGELLFDMEVDAGEWHDLSRSHPAMVEALREEVARWEADLERSRPRFSVK